MTEGTDNTVYVGKKGAMAYVMAVVTQMNQGANEVFIKARGKAIAGCRCCRDCENKFSSEAKIESHHEHYRKLNPTKASQ